MLFNAVNAGTGTEARLSNMPVAGKTGTTTADCDRWFVGFTPYYVAAVWTGYDTPEKISCYGNPAAQIWRSVMAPIHADLPYKAFPTPEIGRPTGIFGNLVISTPTPSPTPTPTAAPTAAPKPTDPPPPPPEDQPDDDAAMRIWVA